jgi:hypothetical protein
MIPIVLSLEPVRTSLVGVQAFDCKCGRSCRNWRPAGRSSVKRLCPEGDVSLGEQNAGTELKHHKIRIKVSYTSIMCWNQTSQPDPVTVG